MNLVEVLLVILLVLLSPGPARCPALRTHVLDGDACWCLPELVLLEQGMVIVHRQPLWQRFLRLLRSR